MFGIPGFIPELYRGLARSSINHVTPRHEQALACWLTAMPAPSGKPGVLHHHRSGMTNITTAMGQAYADLIPMSGDLLARPATNWAAVMAFNELPNQSALVKVAAFSHTLMSASELWTCWPVPSR